MLELAPITAAGRPPSVLAIGAHSDDIEIGCGATLLRLVEEYPGLQVCWVVLSAVGEREEEARAAARAFLAGATGDVRCASFEDAFFPHDRGVKEYFEGLKRELDPDIVLTHAPTDLHQDHRTVCELAWNTFRDHVILGFEIPKYDADLGAPNVFVPLDERHARRKAELLVEHFATQRSKHWFTEDLFLGLMRLRGAECRAPGGYAEAFHGRKLRIGLGKAAR